MNHHLESAIRSAAEGRSDTVHLPLDQEEQWTPELLGYWERFGDRVGEDVSTEAQSAKADVAGVRTSAAPGVRLRAVRIRQAVVPAIEPLDVNIVVERLEPAPGDLFDVIVATNVLVYYDPFDQAMAVANVARMLRPGTR